MTIQKLVVPVEWKAVDGDANTLEGYASTFGNIDLQGDVVQKGAFAKTIRTGKRWPLLADHNASTGSVLGSIVAASEDTKGLRIRADFSTAASAQDVRTKMLEGHIDRMSIGYEPKAWEFSQDANGESIRLLKEVKLWEVSVVVFPANPEAVVDRVKQLLVETAQNGMDAGEVLSKAATAAAEQLRNGTDTTTGDEPTEQDDSDGADATEVAEPLDEEPASEDKADGTDVEAKTAIGSHSTATSDASWDGPANAARLPSGDSGDGATLRKAYAWVDSNGDPDAKASYKFIHHFVAESGSVGAASTVACSSGIAVLNGARQGTTIPAGDRQGVYNHLARHLRDAGMTPPDMASMTPDTAEKSADALEQVAAAVAPDLSYRMRMITTDALLEGRDPDALADQVKLAGTETRLEFLEQWATESGAAAGAE